MDSPKMPMLTSSSTLKAKLPKYKSFTPSYSPRCALRIPDRNQIEEVFKEAFSEFPPIKKTRTAANTPLKISSRILKNKDYEFPEILKKAYKVIVTDIEQKETEKNVSSQDFC